jgi:hypothetical protein
MAENDTSLNARSSYRYLHFMPEELAQVPPDELLQASLESRRLLQISIARHCYNQIGIFRILLRSVVKDPMRVRRVTPGSLVATRVNCSVSATRYAHTSGGTFLVFIALPEQK